MARKTKKTTHVASDEPAGVLKSRHAVYKSWLIVSDELGYNKGVLCAVANGKRKPSHALIDRMNERYGLHLPYPVVTIHAQPCAKCGQLHAFSRRCPGASLKYKAHPVMRISKIRRILQEPYLKDS